jgi:hypothetical protein
MLLNSDPRLPEHWELMLCHLALSALDAEPTNRPFLYRHGRFPVYVVPSDEGSRLDIHYGVRRHVTCESLMSLEPSKIASRAYASFTVSEGQNPPILVTASKANARCRSELKKWSIQRPC